MNAAQTAAGQGLRRADEISGHSNIAKLNRDIAYIDRTAYFKELIYRNGKQYISIPSAKRFIK